MAVISLLLIGTSPFTGNSESVQAITVSKSQIAQTKATRRPKKSSKKYRKGKKVRDQTDDEDDKDSEVTHEVTDDHW